MDIKFGIVMDNEAQLSILSSDYVQKFELLKLSAPLWESEAWRGLSKQKYEGLELHLFDVADATLCRLMPELELSLQLDFATKFSDFCERAVAANIASVNSLFDVEKALSDGVYRARFLRLLQSFSGNLRLPLLLPLRLPRNSNLGDYSSFMNEFSSSVFGLAVSLHPHEPSFVGLSSDTLRPVRFSVQTVDVVYEPLLGNRLDFEVLREHIKCLGKFGNSVRIFFNPIGLNGDSLGGELDILKDFIRSIKEL